MINPTPISSAQKPRHVLMTADCVGGVWTYALELTRALGLHGVQVALAVMGGPVSNPQRKEAAAISNLELFESTWKLEWMENPWRDVAAAGDWLLDLEHRLCPGVIHLNGYVHGVLPWKAPVIVVGHSCVLSWWQAVRGETPPSCWEVYRKAVQAGLRSAARIITPSQTMLSALAHHYGPLTTSQVIHNGRRLPPATSLPREQLILSAGRLWDGAKNVSALVSIALDLTWPVALAGEDVAPNGERITRRHVRYLGRLSSEELVSWFARAAIYVLPARYEPFGLSILEAALSGCALVVGDIPSLREIWDGAALFVSPDDPQSLRAVLERLINHPAELACWAAKAGRTAARYTPEQMADAYFQAYCDVLLNPQLVHRLPASIACAS
jgi:glycogen synthase